MARMDDGYRTIVTFDGAAIEVWEKTVTPPGMDGGGGIPTTTMRNNFLRTKDPKQLVDFTDLVFTAAYDPIVYATVIAVAIQINQLITVTFPDGSTVVFWGFLDKFIPGENSEGNQPIATVTVVITNHDNDDNEVIPVYTAA